MYKLDKTMVKSNIAELMTSLGIEYQLEDFCEQPFLSIITRTQGRRPELLKEVMLCLMSQECDDFEWIVVAHKVDSTCIKAIELIIDSTPIFFRKKVRLLSVSDGNRVRPLNVGFEEAKGEYIAVLDDDDIVLANWVMEFRIMAERNSGKVLRAFSLRQDFTIVETKYSRHSAHANEAPARIYLEKFDLLTQLHHNESPNLSLAFPCAAFQKFGIRFDETLTTTEDWDFLLRMASICGVVSSTLPTSIYRWFTRLDTSRFVHDNAEWEKNYKRIQMNINNNYFIFPPGYINNICLLYENYNNLYSMINDRNMIPALSEPVINQEDTVIAEDLQKLLIEQCEIYNKRLTEKRKAVMALFDSTSWRIAWPIRLLQRILGRKPHKRPYIFTMTEEMADRFIVEIPRTISWRSTAWIRKLKSKVRDIIS